MTMIRSFAVSFCCFLLPVHQAACISDGRNEQLNLRRVSSHQSVSANFSEYLSENDEEDQRLLSTHHQNHNGGFVPLPCNTPMGECVNWSDQGYDPSAGMVTIPCGTCVIMDDVGPTLNLENGIDVVGKLVFPDGYRITITTPFFYVQGILEMTSTRATSGEVDVKIILTSSDDNISHSLVPHDMANIFSNNANMCPPTGCNVGNRPFVVAGGQLNINGLQSQCPTWVNLKNVVRGGPPDSSNIPTYIQPAPGCSDVLIDTDFENGIGIGWPNDWYRNYGGTDSYVTDDGINYYALFGGRTSTWNGPQHEFSSDCVEGNVPMFASAKVKLIGITGNTCIKLTYFGQESDGSKTWQNKGTVCTDQDNTWFDFTSSFTLNDQAAYPAQPPKARRFYWEGPPAGVDVAIDDIRIYRAPESLFPDPNTAGTAGICSELFTNGDAEDTTMHPFTYPYSRRSGTGMLSIESEDNSGVLNHYYAMRNRKYSWDNPGYFLLTDCVNANSVFAFHVDIRVHSAAKRTFRLQLTVHKADGSKSWPWLAVCAPQDINDGWVTCSGEYEFDGDEGTAAKVEFYPVSDDSWYDDVDFDNFSMSFKSGPVTDLIVQDATGDLASCWGPGSELLVTSKSLNFDDVDTPVIQAVNHDPTTGTTRLALETPIGITSFADNEPKYGGVEVALLSRNVVFTSDSTAKVGGHLMILHTPNVVQTISGISLVKFGQQGNLGRYPVHFHMCQSVAGSVVSKNVVRQSHQRCYVIHGTNDLTVDSNVAYDTFGHCFMLEDGGEMGNVLTGNLASVTRKVDTLIRPEETDNVPSSFWITNPMNSFIGNVAAGSEHSGFWFEMRDSVRAPTSSMVPAMNPSILPLTLFKDNVAHSNYDHGVKTYPGRGYSPEGTPAVFENTRSFRNKGSGVFIHNSRNINVDGGIFADNRVQIDVDRSPTCSVLNAEIVGYSPEYKALVDSGYLPYHCPSQYPIRGVELHTYWGGGDTNTGTVVKDTSFESFDDSGCIGSTALRIDKENKGYFDVRTSISGVSFVDSSPISGCDAASGYDEELGPIDNVAIYDIDGSIVPGGGFIVSDTERMTKLAQSPCVSQGTGSCLAYCPGSCFRTMGFSVSSFEDDSVELEITDLNTGLAVSFTGEYDWPFEEDGITVNVAEHTKSYRSRRFFATLPAGGDYEARFVKNGQIHWPRYVKTEYEDPGLELDPNCPNFSTFDVIEPVVPDGYCDELITNGDMENGIEGWWATMGGVVSLQDTPTNKALTSEYRTAYWMGPAQFFDSRCMVAGNTYTITAKVKLVDKDDTTVLLDCDPDEPDWTKNTCPKFVMKGESGAWKAKNEFWNFMGVATTWDNSVNGGWNEIVHTFTVTQQMADAGSILLYPESRNLDALMVFDDVSVSLVQA